MPLDEQWEAVKKELLALGWTLEPSGTQLKGPREEDGVSRAEVTDPTARAMGRTSRFRHLNTSLRYRAAGDGVVNTVQHDEFRHVFDAFDRLESRVPGTWERAQLNDKAYLAAGTVIAALKKLGRTDDAERMRRELLWGGGVPFEFVQAVRDEGMRLQGDCPASLRHGLRVLVELCADALRYAEPGNE